MERIDGERFGETVWIEPWRRVGERSGTHDPRTDYVERFWLPILGPAATMFVRHIARSFDAHPTGGALKVAEAAQALGLHERSGRNGPFFRTIARSVDLDMASVLGPGRLAVRRLLPSLTPQQVAGLSPRLAAEHQRAVVTGPSLLDATSTRGRRLALSLLSLGEDVAETERQLTKWHFHPALAAQCAAWASAHHERERLATGAERRDDRSGTPPAIEGARRALTAIAELAAAPNEAR
jgi:hypothetical protein